jgi:hypothetical protein
VSVNPIDVVFDIASIEAARGKLDWIAFQQARDTYRHVYLHSYSTRHGVDDARGHEEAQDDALEAALVVYAEFAR